MCCLQCGNVTLHDFWVLRFRNALRLVTISSHMCPQSESEIFDLTDHLPFHSHIAH